MNSRKSRAGLKQADLWVPVKTEEINRRNAFSFGRQHALFLWVENGLVLLIRIGRLEMRSGIF